MAKVTVRSDAGNIQIDADVFYHEIAGEKVKLAVHPCLSKGFGVFSVTHLGSGMRMTKFVDTRATRSQTLRRSGARNAVDSLIQGRQEEILAKLKEAPAIKKSA